VVPLLLAGAISLVLSLVGTRYLIEWLRAHRVGQPIHEDVPDGHVTKAGTPTMGGVAIVVAAVAGYAAAHFHAGLVFTRTGVLVMLAIAGAAVVGAFDDWIKVSNERNLGLSKRAKMGGLLLVAFGFAVACLAWTDVETTLSFTRWDEPGWNLTGPGWVVFAVLLIAATTNAVNLTDGLDGLAAGSSIYAFITMTVVAFWAFRHESVYEVNHALDLAVIAAAMVGGITGVGDRAGGQLPPVRPAGAADGAGPPPLRAGRMAGDHGHHPVLDPRHHVDGRGPGAVLRGLDLGGGDRVSERSERTMGTVRTSLPHQRAPVGEADGMHLGGLPRPGEGRRAP
jgi:UDP-N-acetylmuramyl pentapeptide phosphotransferase/UDP-N-acetylglucosamine-1-phosphate transferase